MRTITVIDIGSACTIGGDIPATVTGVCITADDGVTYKVAWWDGRTRRVEWLTPAEIVGRASQMQTTIGFEAK